MQFCVWVEGALNVYLVYDLNCDSVWGRIAWNRSSFVLFWCVCVCDWFSNRVAFSLALVFFFSSIFHWSWFDNSTTATVYLSTVACLSILRRLVSVASIRSQIEKDRGCVASSCMRDYIWIAALSSSISIEYGLEFDLYSGFDRERKTIMEKKTHTEDYNSRMPMAKPNKQIQATRKKHTKKMAIYCGVRDKKCMT